MKNLDFALLLQIAKREEWIIGIKSISDVKRRRKATHIVKIVNNSDF